MKAFRPSDRLIVAADFKPRGQMSCGPENDIQHQVLDLADKLRDTGVTIKVNSALRAVGSSLGRMIKERGLPVFADLKLYDIPNTLEADGEILQWMNPAIVTVSCTAGIAAMQALKKELPDTIVLGITVLTSITEETGEIRKLQKVNIPHAVIERAELGMEAGIDGFVCAPTEIALLRKRFSGKDFEIVTPGIRPAWAEVKGDDQNKDRVMTPGDAIREGATRIVVGRPIVQNKDPYQATMRTLDEIAQALPA